MDSSICYIKPEFLIKDNANSITENKTISNNTLKRPATLDSEEPENKRSQKNENGKNNRKRGQNKNRPVYKEERTSNLCNAYFDGPNVSGCKLTNCKYTHEVLQFFQHKPKDIGDTCYIYSTKGFCPRGLTCRFAKAHLDDQLNNLKAEFYNEKAKLTTLNGISSDLQVCLRKRQYDFSKSFKIIQRYEELLAEKKNTKAEKNDKEKPTGCIIDEGATQSRDLTQKTIVFSNKVILSPLTTVGNLPFRRICKEFGADITCGEMACAVPIVKGLSQEWVLTKRHESEDIFGVQLCGNNTKLITQAAQLLQENSTVDFIDLNIGCPIELIYNQGGGSALIRRQNVLEAVVKTCSTLLENIPFTVKTRTGIYANKSVAHDLLPNLEEWGASAVTLHGRSREQRYTKSSNWEYIEYCASKVKNIPVIGNGDILNFEDYNEKKKLAPHVSSVMIGRGALIKPWIFKEIKEQKHWNPSSSERLEILKKFVNYGLEHWGSDTKGVENTRRFLLEWQSFLYRYVPLSLLEFPPQTINQRPQKYYGRDNLETLFSSNNCLDWIKISEMLLGPIPDGFTFLPKHKANSYS